MPTELTIDCAGAPVLGTHCWRLLRVLAPKNNLLFQRSISRASRISTQGGFNTKGQIGMGKEDTASSVQNWEW